MTKNEHLYDVMAIGSDYTAKTDIHMQLFAKTLGILGTWRQQFDDGQECITRNYDLKHMTISIRSNSPTTAIVKRSDSHGYTVYEFDGTANELTATHEQAWSCYAFHKLP